MAVGGRINMFYPYVAPQAIKKVQEALEGRWIGQGPAVDEFENALRDKFNLPRTVAVNSASAAIRLALAIAGVGPQDEVITTAQCCTAVNHPILEQYAVPVFADIQYDTGNLNPADIQQRITERTKAIIAVDLGGYPCDIDEIQGIAGRHNLAFIEDASDALGAEYKGRHIGATARFTIFSFAAVQLLTTGEGGALCCADKDDAAAAIRRRWYGIDRKQRRPALDGYYDFDVTEAGYGYHMTNIAAAMGLANLEQLEKILIRRREIARRYGQELNNVPGVRLFERRQDKLSAYQFFTIHVENRDNFCRMMREKEVEVSIVHARNDGYSVFGGRRGDLPVLDKYAETNISIPLHYRLSDDDAGRIIRLIRGGW